VADHVIIGSGINGLVAASLLTLKGDRVTVPEREAVPGGCLRTEKLLPGFQHDVMAATWVLFMTSPAGAALRPHLARLGFEHCHTPHPTAVLRPNGEAVVLSMDRATNVSAFNVVAADDGDRFASDAEGIAADVPFLFALLGGSLWSWAATRLMFGQWRKRGMAGLAAWFGRALDPTRCPPGKAVLWLQVPDAPRVIRGDAAGEIEGRDWDSVREAFANRIERILARHIKGFDKRILARKAYSPADLERMNINLVGGDPYGGACSIDQFFLWRPFPHSPGALPLKGLIHIGASTHPGPGLGGGSGFNAAKRLGA
jgi:phytoene dehydrogenase-like protein